MKVTRLKTGGFLTSGSDAGDLEILRKSNDYDDGSNMKAGGPVKSKLKKVINGLKKASKTHAGQAKTLSTIKMKEGGKTKSKVNEAGNYTKPGMRKQIFNRIKAGGKGGRPGQWSARKAQMMAKSYKKAGGGYK
tara:strand:- start:170 stop:571 length:402 start_codon:yes stop_codon:yes gene_type:complete